MRTISSSIMAALVVVALFWGNCFSCPQALLAAKTHEPAHQCCHKTKAPTPGCESQSLQNFVKADAGFTTPAAAIVAIVIEQPIALTGERAPAPAEFLPPDLVALHTVIRI